MFLQLRLYLLETHFRRFPSYFEFGGEVIGRIEIELISYFLDAHICGGEQFLGTLEFQVLLIVSWTDARIFLEQFTEVAVTYPLFLCYLLYGEIALQCFTYAQTGSVYHIHMALVLT